jgi:hypothetical protein
MDFKKIANQIKKENWEYTSKKYNWKADELRVIYKGKVLETIKL